MAKFKSTGKLTLASDGSLIRVGATERALFMKERFGLGAPKVLVFKKSKKKVRAEGSSSDKTEQELIELDSNENDDGTGSGIEKWTPKAEDLVRIPFRGLSATIVAGGTWRATDFSDEAMLKRSMSKLIGKSAFTEHLQYADNCIGVIESTSWSDSKVQDGRKVPAGIDLVYLINAEQNEKLVSNLLMDPPAIYSNSVTVEFEWEPSHDDFQDEDDFIRNIGKVGPDNRMIARKVTNIIDYHESSILWLGADPFAKMIDKDGNLVNPEYGAAFDQVAGVTKELYSAGKQYFASYSFKKEGIVLSTEIENKKDNVMDKQLLEAVKVALGLKATDEVTAEHLAKFSQMTLVKNTDHVTLTASLQKAADLEKEVQELKAKGTDETLKKQNSDLANEVVGLKREKGDLELKVTELSPLAEVGKSTLEAKRNETIRLYKLQLADGQAEDATLIETFKKADDKQLNGFLAMFAKGTAEKFEAHCTKCQSTEVEFRSTLTPESGLPGSGSKGTTEEHLAITIRS